MTTSETEEGSMTPSQPKMRARLLQAEEMCGPIHPLMGNYFLYCMKREMESSDWKEFGELLLEELEK
jgi:hypothetical protein